VVTSPYWTGITAAAMFDVVREMGLEGLICKRATSVYQPGRRSHNWIKSVVRQRAPMVIGGWVPGRAGDIGSVLVGAHDDNGVLSYCGQVGFGLSGPMRRTLTDAFAGLHCEHSPFADLPAAEGAHWLTPTVVVSVDYRDFNGRLRHPSLKGTIGMDPATVTLPRPGEFAT
ncbi:hypothetical protein ACQKHK_12405, partial [Staphylococcus capitis]